MKKGSIIKGRIEQHGVGHGLSNEDMARERAREIAITNGRKPEQFTEADLQQAREELQAAQHALPETVEDEQEEFTPREGPIGVTSGSAARTKLATDEQTLPEELVREGVDEATHELMVEGNQESRRRDENFDDQLPGSES